MNGNGEKRERIILVEDDPIIAEVTILLLQRLHYQVVKHARSGTEAIKAVLTQPVDLILMDIMLDGKLDGIEAAQYCYHLMHVPIVFVTGNMSEDILNRSKIAEPFGFIIKPITSATLHSTIQIALNTFKCTSTWKTDRVDDISNIEQMGFGMVIVDINGRILYLNQIAENMLNTNGATLHYQTIVPVFKPQDFKTEEFITEPNFLQIMRSMLTTGAEKHLFMTTLNSGQKRPFVIWALPIQSMTSDYLGAVLIIRNLEERTPVAT